MLLAVDIGNSNTKFGIFDSERLFSKFSVPTGSEISDDILRPRFADASITQAIICSVVPEKVPSVKDVLYEAFGIDSFVVGNELDLGLKISYEPLSALGTDRLVNSFAAAEKYGTPCIVCSIGTATTFDIVNTDRELLGGAITAGMKTMAKALHLNTSELPEIEIAKPESVIGNSTDASIQSGIFYGHIAMVEGMIQRINTEINYDPKVIATGGFASLIAETTNVIDIVDENLLLDGLRLLYKRIHPE